MTPELLLLWKIGNLWGMTVMGILFWSHWKFHSVRFGTWAWSMIAFGLPFTVIDLFVFLSRHPVEVR